jgi:hypothetical protein
MDMVHLPGKGTGARRVPLILTPDVVEAMICLVEHRADCGIPNTNVYFFAVPASNGFVNGWQVTDRIAKFAQLVNPELIHSTRLRKYIATVTQVLYENINVCYFVFGRRQKNCFTVGFWSLNHTVRASLVSFYQWLLIMTKILL